MPPALRRAQILQRIRRDGGVSVAELARAHDVSAITVHRDLEQLAAEGLVERVHGGARAISPPEALAGPVIATAWSQRVEQAAAAKDAIAARAAELVTAGSTIFLDASSTCFALAHRLDLEPPEELSIVTNSPAIALGLEGGAVRVIMAPGEVDLRMRVVADGWTLDFLRRVSMDVAFVSGAGLDLRHGLTTSRRQVADALNAARAAAAQTVALVDATKFGRSSLVPIAAATDFDVVVSDAELDGDVAAEYRAAGVKLEIAPELSPDDEL